MMRIRLPDDVKAELKARAEENRRSMNAEIVARLERTIAEDAERTAQALKAIQASPAIRMEKRLISVETDLREEIDALKARVEALEKKQ